MLKPGRLLFIAVLLALVGSACARHDPAAPDARFRLHQAILKGNPVEVQAWMKAGLSPREEPEGDNCDTAMGLAARFQRVEMLESLVEAGADVNAAVDTEGRTALMCAAQAIAGPETIPFLLARGAAVDAKDKSGWTALMHAAGDGGEANVNALLKGKAAVDARNTAGRSAIEIADTAHKEDVVQLLKAAGAGTKHLAKKWTVERVIDVRSVNGITFGDTWDDALPNMGSRVGEIQRSGPDVFTDTRQIGAEVYEITFRRPAETEDGGPYRVSDIKRQVRREVPR